MLTPLALRGPAAALLATLCACSSSEKVLPFIDAGPACGAPGHVDCSQHPELTCFADGGAAACGRLVYGCADAAYFADVDLSSCPPGEAGAD